MPLIYFYRPWLSCIFLLSFCFHCNLLIIELSEKKCGFFFSQPGRNCTVETPFFQFIVKRNRRSAGFTLPLLFLAPGLSIFAVMYSFLTS